jgi:hypothetical protein
MRAEFRDGYFDPIPIPMENGPDGEEPPAGNAAATYAAKLEEYFSEHPEAREHLEQSEGLNSFHIHIKKPGAGESESESMTDLRMPASKAPDLINEALPNQVLPKANPYAVKTDELLQQFKLSQAMGSSDRASAS